MDGFTAQLATILPLCSESSYFMGLFSVPFEGAPLSSLSTVACVSTLSSQLSFRHDEESNFLKLALFDFEGSIYIHTCL